MFTVQKFISATMRLRELSRIPKILPSKFFYNRNVHVIVLIISLHYLEIKPISILFIDKYWNLKNNFAVINSFITAILFFNMRFIDYYDRGKFK